MSKQQFWIYIFVWLVIATLAVSSCYQHKKAMAWSKSKKSAPCEVEKFDVEKEAARLRSKYDEIHIYSTSNGLEVWSSSVIQGGLVGLFTNIVDARVCVSNYYIQWAERLRPKAPVDGKLVE